MLRISRDVRVEKRAYHSLRVFSLVGQAIDLARAPQAEPVLDLFAAMAVEILVYSRPDKSRTRLTRSFGKGVQRIDPHIVHVDKGSHRALR